MASSEGNHASGPNVTRSQVVAFAEALAQALFDRAMEDRRPILYYCDADVVVGMVFGFEAQYERGSKGDLVRALLSAGFLGQVHVLRLHALEIHSALQRLQRGTRSPKTDAIPEGVQANIKLLRDALLGAGSRDERMNNFLTLLRQTGTDTFIAFELTNGTWQQRLHRIRSVLRFDDSGPDLRELLRSPEVWQFNEAISRVREPRSSHMVLNNVTDASALVVLHQMIRASEEDPTKPLIRFYTVTQPILRAITADSPVAPLIRYRLEPEWRKEAEWGADLALRSTEYYVIRASFEALAFPTQEVSQRPHDGTSVPAITIADLSHVWEELTQALQRDDIELAREIETTIRIGDRTLRQIIGDMEQSALLDRLFGGSYATTGAFRDLIEEAVDTFSDDGSVPERSSIRQRLAEEAHDLAAELEHRMSSLQQWLLLLRAVHKRVAHLGADPNNFRITDPARDLGLLRWTDALTDDHAAFLRRVVRDLFSSNEQYAILAGSELADSAQSAVTESECIAVSSVLWMLNLFARVIDTINAYDNRLQGSNANLSLPLDIMRTAARLRMGQKEFSLREKETHVLSLSQLVKELGASASGSLYLGLAYVAYYIAATERESETTVRRWSQQSLDWSEEAIRRFVVSPMGRAFAINHCAYLGTQFEFLSAQTKDYLAALEELQSNESLWHYRFADTLASALLSDSQREWERAAATPDDEMRNEIRKRGCKHLLLAEGALENAYPSFGDPEIPEHRLEIARLRQKLGCDPVRDSAK